MLTGSYLSLFFVSHSSSYIHGITPAEQNRLTILNDLLNERCLQKIKITSGSRVLDVGSGLGIMTESFSKKAGPNGFCLGIERSDAQLKTASGLQKKGLEFRKGDAYQLPLTTDEISSFDLVYCRFLLEHLPDPNRAAKEMLRALKPGGQLIIADDDHQNMILYPEPEGFQTLWSAYIDSYLMIGNDPFIGRKLPRLLLENGCKEVRNDLVFFGDVAGTPSFEFYAKNLCEVIATARGLMLENDLILSESYESAMNNLRSWTCLNYASAYYSLCIATGIKS